MHKPLISLIAAIGENRELGRDNKLLFHMAEDMKFFREKTRGHVVIMGRKTYESIGRPLPNRINIVITRDVDAYIERHPELRYHEMASTRGGISGSGFRVKLGMTGGVGVSSLEEALEFGKTIEQEEVFIIGGAQIYQQAIPFADKLYLTLVDRKVTNADAFFPDYSEFKNVVSERKSRDENYVYSFLELTR